MYHCEFTQQVIISEKRIKINNVRQKIEALAKNEDCLSLKDQKELDRLYTEMVRLEADIEELKAVLHNNHD